MKKEWINPTYETLEVLETQTGGIETDPPDGDTYFDNGEFHTPVGSQETV